MEEKIKRKSPILEIWRRLKERSKNWPKKGQGKNPEEKKGEGGSGT